ncbi:MAG: tetratricopeptide repeat protein [Gammaproteobacteria bacterium]|nr:tetratricopeptide repeat protein [Gammaproteobacteria bacterium]
MSRKLFIKLVNQASAANNEGNFVAAKKAASKATRMDPEVPEAWYQLGFAQAELGEKKHALRSLEEARARVLNSADAQNSIGLAMLNLGAYQEAERCFVLAVNLRPDFAFAHSNLGKLYEEQKRMQDAEAYFKKALHLDPELAPAHANLGAVLVAQGLDEAAETACRKAIELDAGLSDAWRNLGSALFGQREYPSAIECFTHAMQLNPDLHYLRSELLEARMNICDWSSFDKDREHLLKTIADKQNVTTPFSSLWLSSDAAIQKQAGENFVKEKYPPKLDLDPSSAVVIREKIRIGYFSADFREHPVSQLIAEVFELHDKERFETFAFSFGPDIQDEMRARVARTFDEFIDVRMMSDKDIARLSREKGIDIAVDLMGFSTHSRTGIFCHRAAPAQVNYLGYPGTMSAPYMDYIVGDTTVIPEEDASHYSEVVVYLPYCYQPNDNKRQISERPFPRDALGLPVDGFVFCCFNNSYKITPQTFAVWMQLLQKVDESVLWLRGGNQTLEQNLCEEAGRYGIDGARLVFAERLPIEEHLARHRAADLFLDTLPYNAHTTASDALWAGLPVLTQVGTSFASRVAASLLRAIELPELITTSQEEYAALALELALDPDRLSLIKSRLQKNRLTTPLFNTNSYTQYLEEAYIAIHERNCSGLPPDQLHIMP